MKYLAIDTSGSHLSVIVNNEGNISGSYIENCNLQHSVILMSEIEKCFVKSGIIAEDCDFFACAVGAGSFTGIRIGVSTIKAFAYALKRKVLSVTSFDLLAYNENIEGKNLAVIDARHGSYYVCGYDCGKVVFEPEFINAERLSELSKEYSLISSAVIDGFESKIVDVYQGLINAVDRKCGFAMEDRESLVPLYIRKSQAEENR